VSGELALSHQFFFSFISEKVELAKKNKELPRTPCVLVAGLNWHGAKRQRFV